jgi:hypothetical protein
MRWWHSKLEWSVSLRVARAEGAAPTGLYALLHDIERCRPQSGYLRYGIPQVIREEAIVWAQAERTAIKKGNV